MHKIWWILLHHLQIPQFINFRAIYTCIQFNIVQTENFLAYRVSLWKISKEIDSIIGTCATGKFRRFFCERFESRRLLLQFSVRENVKRNCETLPVARGKE